MKFRQTMKRIITLLLITFSFIVFGQNDNGKKLLQEVSKKVKAYENISIDFKYVLENAAENVKQETRGDVVLQGDKYVFNILGVTRLYDGKKIYTISSEDEEVTISSNDYMDEESVTPSKMLSFYEEGYTYKMDIEQNVQGRKVQFIKLTPIDTNSEIKNILLGVDSQTKHIYKLIQMGKNGTKTTLTVNSFKTNEPLPRTLFIFDSKKYADYYINELD